MKQNFGSNFLQGFQPNFANTFNTTLRYNLSQQEQERERRRQEEEAKKQQGYLSDLIKGTKQSFSYGGMYSPLVEQQVPLTKEEQFGRYTQLSPANQNAYEWWNRQNAPKEVKKGMREFGGDLYEVNEDGTLGKVIKQGEKKPDKIWIKDERFGDKMKKLMGFENPDADENDPQTRIVNGKKYTITDYTVNDIWEKKTGGDGKDRFSLKDEIKKSLGDYYKKQQEYLAFTEAGFGNKKVNGKESEVTYKEKLNNHNKVYVEAVKNTMSETARKWYDDLYNYQDDDKKMGNPHPQDYWNTLRNDYVEGKLGKDPNKEDDYEDADFQILTENFKAIYGFDPTQVYGY